VYRSGTSKKIVYIDQQHNNIHSLYAGFKPFGKLLSANGFKPLPFRKKYNKETLGEIQVLVIANALNNKNFEIWDAPNPSAFDSREIKALHEWVSEGGSLFLIADHMPFAGAASELASKFGFTFYNGFAMDADKNTTGDLFVKANGGLKEGPMVQGVDSIVSFTGQLFDTPAEATKIMIADDRFTIHLTQKAWNFEGAEQVKGSGKCQLAYMKYGKGKIVVAGEAAMFTAQINHGEKVGMNSAKAKNNYKLLLNLVGWLVE
jgi:hypothetical protein